MKRIAVIGTPNKEMATAAFDRVIAWLKPRCNVVFAELTVESRRALDHAPDLLFVLGGDGTLIAAIHDLGSRQMPIVGVNRGKIGYLAEFTVEQLERDGDFLFEPTPPITRRVMLSVRIDYASGEKSETLAVNDFVILAGAPFRMIEIVIGADREKVARFRGDGLIIATASGSTAHNLSAGGPILDPSANSFVLTPICPYSLTYRPVVVDSNRRISVHVEQTNEGTTAAIDGRLRHAFQVGDRVTITRYPADLQLVRSPNRSLWYALRRKLMWGKNPRNSY
jgi:NAD+ kinase